MTIQAVIIHCDISLSNLMVYEDGDSPSKRSFSIDFDILKFASQN